MPLAHRHSCRDAPRAGITRCRNHMAEPLPRLRPGVLYQAVADGGVLLDTESEIYFGLNAVGARVCELLESHTSVDDLCAALASAYPEVPLSVLLQDVAELLDDLVGHGLLERVPARTRVEPTANADAPTR
jgi:hypothetical protein